MADLPPECEESIVLAKCIAAELERKGLNGQVCILAISELLIGLLRVSIKLQYLTKERVISYLESIVNDVFQDQV